MAYIAGIVIVALLFLALHYFTEITKQQKIIVSTLFSVVLLSAIAYNSYSTMQREKMMNVVIKFNQNKSVTCSGVDVNKSDFTLSVGTYTFIGKKDKPNYGQMISVSTCE